jgi:hypothetical protein
MDVSEAINQKTIIDALVVLGHGVDGNGELTHGSMRRSEVAVHVADLLHPRIVVFSGGRSWRQVVASELPPVSEGQAMLEHAKIYSARKSNQPLSDKIDWETEDESTSTVANLANSSRLLNLQRGETLGLLSDDLHNLYNRVAYLGQLVFPKNKTLPLTFKTIFNQNEKDEERRIAYATRFMMFGVRAGNIPAIMRRQRALEAANIQLRKIGSSILRPAFSGSTGQTTAESPRNF